MGCPRPGFVHESAVIGEPPEHRDWHDGQPCYIPSIHSTAQINAFVTVDAGLRDSTRIGANVFLMAHCHVGHDAEIGDNCELAPGTVIGGHVVLEPGVRCGVGVLVLPFKRVGAGARLGAGAVVTRDVPAGEVWVGNPARRLRKPMVCWARVPTRDNGAVYSDDEDTIAELVRLGRIVVDGQAARVTAVPGDPNQADVVFDEPYRPPGQQVTWEAA